MRRSLILSAVFGAMAVGVGCKAVGGRCDCGYSPAEAHLPQPGMAYPTIGAPVGGVVSTAPAAVAQPTPEKMPVPTAPPVTGGK